MPGHFAVNRSQPHARRWRRWRPLLVASLLALASDGARANPSGCRIERGELAMPDGVRLAATYFLPAASRTGERFPVLLELLPYRKDDSFYLRDLPHHAFWAGRGFVSVKVDLRGTGSSEGRVPEREYAEAELDDAVEIVRQLAAMPWSNGRVAMWGISWGGFNAYQVALRKPPALAAIVAVHASDDLWRDGIDYLDGILHLDPYHLQIHHENGLPRPPDYPLDDAYFRDRFDVRPWLFDHLGEPRDGAFWRPGIRLARGARLEVPVYAIAGLLDGYRDFPLRLLERAHAPVRVEVGPWNHDWPHGGAPGPNYEWGENAVRFLERFLVDGERPDPAERTLVLFQREGHAPDAALTTTPGAFRATSWPVPGTAERTWLAGSDGRLVETDPAPGARRLAARAGAGTAAGIWWGEPTGDQREDDAQSLVYDSAPLAIPLAIAGFPRVRVLATFDRPAAHLVARLEEVDPEGRVSLVTAAALDGRQRPGGGELQPLPVGESVPLELELHFTTWTFRAGHRIRLALSTAQFPMLWPAPAPVRLEVRSAADPEAGTWLRLPTVPAAAGRPAGLPPPAPREARADAAWLECGEGPDETEEVVRDVARGTTRYVTRTACAWRIGARIYRSTEANLWEVEDERPAVARYRGEESHRIELEGGRLLELASTLELASDATHFHLRFARRIAENGREVRSREWRQSYARP